MSKTRAVKDTRQKANKRKIGSGILAMVNVMKLTLMSMGKYNDTAYLHTTKTLNYCTLIATLGIAAPLTLNTRHHNTIPYTQLALLWYNGVIVALL